MVSANSVVSIKWTQSNEMLNKSTLLHKFLKIVLRKHYAAEAGTFRSVAFVLSIGDNGKSPYDYW